MKGLKMFLVLAAAVFLFGGTVFAGSHDESHEKGVNAAEFYGVIESMPEKGNEGTWVINGRKVQVSSETIIKEKRGKAAAGAHAEVKGRQTGDVFTASAIEIEERRDVKRSAYPGKFYGTIESLPQDGPEGVWVVNGREITVSAKTVIREKHGKVAAGAYVEVEGDYSGKTFIAYEISVKGDRTEKQGRTYNSEFSGIIEDMPREGHEGVWTIDGRKVIVDVNTVIDEKDGKAAAGAYVKVKGSRAGKSFTAYEIETERKVK